MTRAEQINDLEMAGGNIAYLAKSLSTVQGWRYKDDRRLEAARKAALRAMFLLGDIREALGLPRRPGEE